MEQTVSGLSSFNYELSPGEATFAVTVDKVKDDGKLRPAWLLWASKPCLPEGQGF